MKDIVYLPAGSYQNNWNPGTLHAYLRKLFIPLVRKQFPQHFLSGFRSDHMVFYIEENAGKYPFFLQFDVDEFNPYVSHEIVYRVLISNYQKLSSAVPSDNEKQNMFGYLGDFFRNRSNLLWEQETKRVDMFIVSLLFMGICHTISRFPFVCTRRKFLVFCSSMDEVENIKHDLTGEFGSMISSENIKVGLFAHSSVEIAGFRVDKGQVWVSSKAEFNFQARILKLTLPNRKYKSKHAFIKQINTQVNRFGNYYKYGQVSFLFASLDALIYQHVSRYLLENGMDMNETVSASKEEPGQENRYGLHSLLTLLSRQTNCKGDFLSKIRCKTKPRVPEWKLLNSHAKWQEWICDPAIGATLQRCENNFGESLSPHIITAVKEIRELLNLQIKLLETIIIDWQTLNDLQVRINEFIPETGNVVRDIPGAEDELTNEWLTGLWKKDYKGGDLN